MKLYKEPTILIASVIIGALVLCFVLIRPNDTKATVDNVTPLPLQLTNETTDTTESSKSTTDTSDNEIKKTDNSQTTNPLTPTLPSLPKNETANTENNVLQPRIGASNE